MVDVVQSVQDILDKDAMIIKLDKAIKGANHDRGCHYYDSWTDFSRPYCSCTARGKAAYQTMFPEHSG
jgi:hypothetical protein